MANRMSERHHRLEPAPTGWYCLACLKSFRRKPRSRCLGHTPYRWSTAVHYLHS